ncbi:MAG: GNAT family N-acetyltransferase [Gemmatimonadota bacterium]
MPETNDPTPAELELATYRSGDEEQLFSILAQCHPHSWGQRSLEHWRWKHRRRPDFNPEDILTIRSHDRLVGCFHGAVFSLRIAPGVTVSASYDGDYAVLPEARGNDLTSRAYAATNPELVRRGVALRGGFTSKELNERLYGKKYGYVFVPTATGQFRKFIGLGPLRRKLAAVGERALTQPRLRKALARRPLAVGLAIGGLPEAVLSCTEEAFTLVEAPAHRASVSVELPYTVLATLPDGTTHFVREFVRALLKREARIRGMATALLRSVQIAAAVLLPALARPDENHDGNSH